MTPAALAVFARWRLEPLHCARQALAYELGDAFGERGLAAWREALQADPDLEPGQVIQSFPEAPRLAQGGGRWFICRPASAAT